MISIIDLNNIILIYLCKYLNISDKNKFKLVCRSIYNILKDDYTLTFKQEHMTKALLWLKSEFVTKNNEARKLVYSVLSENDGKTLSILTYLSIKAHQGHKCIIITQRLLVNYWIQEHKKLSLKQKMQPLAVYKHEKYSLTTYTIFDMLNDNNDDSDNINKELEILTKNNIVIIDEETWHKIISLCKILYDTNVVIIFDNVNSKWWTWSCANIILINSNEKNIYNQYKKIDIDFTEEKTISLTNVPSVSVINIDINNQNDLNNYISNTINQCKGKILLVIKNPGSKYMKKLNINKILANYNVVYVNNDHNVLAYDSMLDIDNKIIKEAFELDNGIVCISFSIFSKLYNIKSFRKPSAIIYLNYNNDKQYYEDVFSIIKISKLVPFYYINLYKNRQINKNICEFLFETARYEKSKFHPYEIFKIIKYIDEDIITKNIQSRLLVLQILVNIINKKYIDVKDFDMDFITNNMHIRHIDFNIMTNELNYVLNYVLNYTKILASYINYIYHKQ